MFQFFQISNDEGQTFDFIDRENAEVFCFVSELHAGDIVETEVSNKKAKAKFKKGGFVDAEKFRSLPADAFTQDNETESEDELQPRREPEPQPNELEEMRRMMMQLAAQNKELEQRLNRQRLSIEQAVQLAAERERLQKQHDTLTGAFERADEVLDLVRHADDFAESVFGFQLINLVSGSVLFSVSQNFVIVRIVEALMNEIESKRDELNARIIEINNM